MLEDFDLFIYFITQSLSKIEYVSNKKEMEKSNILGSLNNSVIFLIPESITYRNCVFLTHQCNKHTEQHFSSFRVYKAPLTQSFLTAAQQSRLNFSNYTDKKTEILSRSITCFK
jgi:hypothetical protein